MKHTGRRKPDQCSWPYNLIVGKMQGHQTSAKYHLCWQTARNGKSREPTAISAAKFWPKNIIIRKHNKVEV
jgi:hypothetical protein